jgi:hypothetical protein
MSGFRLKKGRLESWFWPNRSLFPSESEFSQNAGWNLKLRFFCAVGEKNSPVGNFWAQIHNGPIDGMNNYSTFFHFLGYENKNAFSSKYGPVACGWSNPLFTHSSYLEIYAYTCVLLMRRRIDL